MVKRISKKERLINRKKLVTVAWFLIKFNLLAIPLYIVLFLNLSFEPLQVFLAYLTSAIIKFFGYTIEQEGYLLGTVVGNQILQIEISWDSTGWKSLYALFALTLATPVGSMMNKIKFLLVGLPSIFIINILRIITTIIVSLSYGIQYFDVIHTLLWREGLILAVIMIWYLWLRKEKYNIR